MFYGTAPSFHVSYFKLTLGRVTQPTSHLVFLLHVLAHLPQIFPAFLVLSHSFTHLPFPIPLLKSIRSVHHHALLAHPSRCYTHEPGSLQPGCFVLFRGRKFHNHHYDLRCCHHHCLCLGLRHHPWCSYQAANLEIRLDHYYLDHYDPHRATFLLHCLS